MKGENRTWSALVAEDEPRLGRMLTRDLGLAWPELEVVAVVEDGLSAVEQAFALQPDILFLDIKMPGKTGLEVAHTVAKEWHDSRKPPPLFVFVTSYDEFALAAFESAAVDYLLKPVDSARLAMTINRLQATLSQRGQDEILDASSMLAKLSELIRSHEETPRLTTLRATVGRVTKMIPMEDVICFEATDKYVNVVYDGGEALVRMSLRDLLAEFGAHEFVKVHRAVAVRSRRILTAQRDEAGRFTLTVRGLEGRVAVSRSYAHLFKPM